jgi:hypothetical protein
MYICLCGEHTLSGLSFSASRVCQRKGRERREGPFDVVMAWLLCPSRPPPGRVRATGEHHAGQRMIGCDRSMLAVSRGLPSLINRLDDGICRKGIGECGNCGNLAGTQSEGA